MMDTWTEHNHLLGLIEQEKVNLYKIDTHIIKFPYSKKIQPYLSAQLQILERLEEVIKDSAERLSTGGYD